MITGNRTITALLTPLAPGALAVIGLAGPQTDAILQRVLRRPHSDRPPRLDDCRPALCRLAEGGQTVDDCIVVRVVRRDTPTAEINIHGGVRVAQRTLGLLAGQGAAIVPGIDYCTALADANLVEGDVDRALLTAGSRRLVRWLLRQRMILPPCLARLDSLGCQEFDAFVRRSRTAIRLLRGLRIALVGPSNVGKSTLANRLIGTDRVLTSDQPGTTRDWVSETAFIDGWPVTLTDTAGVRRTSCPIEAEAIRRGASQARSADLVVLLLDATADAAANHRHSEELGSLLPPDQPRIVVLNKCDVIQQDDLRRIVPTGSAGTRRLGKAVPSMHDCAVLLISALTGTGIETLEARISSLLGLHQLNENLPTAFLPGQIPESA
jgi:tRNA modification GTPase